MPKGAGYYEPISEDSSLLTDEEKEVTRRNALANEIRKVFFGAELHEIQTLLTQYKADMEREARVMGKKLKGKDKETYQTCINNQSEICEQTNKMLDTLQNNKALTKEELANFNNSNNSTILNNPPRGDIPKGEAEKQLTDLLSDVRLAAADLQENEQKKQLDVAFEDRVMSQQWHEKLQEFFQKNDTDIYNPNARNKYVSGGFSTLADNLNKRVGEAVTAIYKGELDLPGLKIDNYMQDETAPQNTAKQLVNTVGAFAFLDYGARASFLGGSTESNYVASKNSNKQPDYGATLDDILLNGNVKALETLKEEQPKMLQDPEGALKKIDDLEKKFDSNQLKFKELKDLQESTRALPEEVWKSVSRGKTQEAEVQLNAAKETAEKELFTNCSKEWLQERFDYFVGSYWDDAMWPGTERLNNKDLKGWTPDENITAMEKTIAAHLCSAYNKYQEDPVWDPKTKTQKWEITKDVLTLDHQPAQPINGNSIGETIDYFRKMCVGKKNATEALKHVKPENIRLYYDSATLNRQAKVYEEKFCDGNLDKTNKDIKMRAYLEAMKRKFDPSEPGAMISRVKGDDNSKKWDNYVSTMLKTNEEFRKAVHDKILIPGREPELKDMENDFIYKLYDNEHKPGEKTEKPDFASYEAKLAKREEQKLPKMPDLSEKYREKITESEKYKKRLGELDETYKEKLTAVSEKKTLVHPTQYNNKNEQSEVLAEAKEKAGENYNKTTAQQKQVGKNLSETFKEINEKALSNDSKKQDDPKNTRITTLDTLLSAVGNSPNREEARKNIMNNTKKLKRGWLNVLFFRNRNKAASRFRNMLEDIAARPDGVEMKPAEMMELYNAAEKVKFSLDQGKKVEFKRKPKDVVPKDAEVVLDKEIDINRYVLATKVAKEMKEKLRTEGLLSPEKTKEQPSVKKQSKQPTKQM